MRKQWTNFKPTQRQLYKVSVLKAQDGYSLDNVLDWIKANCSGKYEYKEFKKNVVFTFPSLDDAFKFKMHWEVAEV